MPLSPRRTFQSRSTYNEPDHYVLANGIAGGVRHITPIRDKPWLKFIERYDTTISDSRMARFAYTDAYE